MPMKPVVTTRQARVGLRGGSVNPIIQVAAMCDSNRLLCVAPCISSHRLWRAGVLLLLWPLYSWFPVSGRWRTLAAKPRLTTIEVMGLSSAESAAWKIPRITNAGIPGAVVKSRGKVGGAEWAGQSGREDQA